MSDNIENINIDQLQYLNVLEYMENLLEKLYPGIEYEPSVPHMLVELYFRKVSSFIQYSNILNPNQECKVNEIQFISQMFAKYSPNSTKKNDYPTKVDLNSIFFRFS